MAGLGGRLQAEPGVGILAGQIADRPHPALFGHPQRADGNGRVCGMVDLPADRDWISRVGILAVALGFVAARLSSDCRARARRYSSSLALVSWGGPGHRSGDWRVLCRPAPAGVAGVAWGAQRTLSRAG